MPFENSAPIPALYLVWSFPRTLTFYVCNHAPRSIPRVGLEVIIWDDVDNKVFS